jgi:hypothetical protein
MRNANSFNRKRKGGGNAFSLCVMCVCVCFIFSQVLAFMSALLFRKYWWTFKFLQAMNL